MQNVCHKANGPPISWTSPSGCTVPAVLAKSFILGQRNPRKAWTAQIQDAAASAFGTAAPTTVGIVRNKTNWAGGATLVLIHLKWGHSQRQGQFRTQAPSDSQHLSSSYSREHLAAPKLEFILPSKAQPWLERNLLHALWLQL